MSGLLTERESVRDERTGIFRDVESFRETSLPSRKTRGRARLIRFAFFELCAFVAMLVCGRLAAAEELLDRSYNQLFVCLVILTATLVAIIPVLFFALPGRESRRSR